MSIQLQHPQTKLSQTLRTIAGSLPAGHITIRDLLEQVGEQGMLLTCMFLALPFIVPVSIPGVSTAFGLLIILIASAVTLDRLPWFPQRIMNKQLSTERLGAAMLRGATLCEKVEKIARPRLLFLTSDVVTNRINGLALMLGGILLMAPFGFVPLTNTLPAIAVLLLAAGVLQRDGVLVLAGYVMNAVTTVYFGVLVYGIWYAGEKGLKGVMG